MVVCVCRHGWMQASRRVRVKTSTMAVEGDVRRRRRQAVVSCCKRVVALFFSHVGLAAMVVAYSILGGFLFRAIEAPHEKRVKVSLQRLASFI